MTRDEKKNKYLITTPLCNFGYELHRPETVVKMGNGKTSHEFVKVSKHATMLIGNQVASLAV